jgi:hypothetical protein
MGFKGCKIRGDRSPEKAWVLACARMGGKEAEARRMETDEPRRFMEANAGERLALIGESFARLTGRALLPDGADPGGLWAAPFALLAHGTEPDPVFFYGNRLALQLFELPADRFVHMPSRLSAEAVDRAERAALLDRVSRHGVIDDYAGVRVAASGVRFRIERASVWNLADEAGVLHGQAAAFSHWTRLD